jgi:hypothetical protein
MNAESSYGQPERNQIHAYPARSSFNALFLTNGISAANCRSSKRAIRRSI